MPCPYVLNGIRRLNIRSLNLGNMLCCQFAIFGSKVFAELGKVLRGINQQHFSLPLRFLVVGQKPDISCDAGVIKKIVRELNDTI